jgi:acyl-coenzyme A thioesterase PaaI-like protein
MERYDVLPPALKEALMQKMKTDSPFWTLLGMELLDARKGWARMRLPFDRKLVHPMGIAHGGAIFSIADSAVAMVLIGMVDRGDAFVTVEMKLNYVLPFRVRGDHRGGPDHPPGHENRPRRRGGPERPGRTRRQGAGDLHDH